MDVTPPAAGPVIVVCTRGRPSRVDTACRAVAAGRPDAAVLVFDASTGPATEQVCAHLARDLPALRLTYERAPRPGLARQRNDAVARCRERGHDIVHFIDDDTLVEAGYFDVLERRLRGEPAVAGAGGVSQHRIGVRLRGPKRLFLIDGGRPGSVLRSGHPVHGQTLDSCADGAVDWLVGASMSWRLAALERHRFDERMVGRSLAEDLCLSYAVGRGARLVVDPAARCLHDQLGSEQGDPHALAVERFDTLHRWVRENRHLGLSLGAFWWSVLGELLLYGVLPLAAPRRPGAQAARQRARGLAVAVGRHARQRAHELVRAGRRTACG